MFRLFKLIDEHLVIVIHVIRPCLGLHSQEDVVEVELNDGSTLWRLVKTGSSYASQSERPLTFGLAKTVTVNSLRVIWPSGQTDTVNDVVGNQSILVQENDGIVAATPIGYAR